MSYGRPKKGPCVQQALLRKLKREQLSQISNDILFRNVNDRVYNVYALEMTRRLVGQSQLEAGDQFVVKQVEKFVKKTRFHNCYLDDALARFKRMMKVPKPLVYDADSFTLAEEN